MGNNTKLIGNNIYQIGPFYNKEIKSNVSYLLIDNAEAVLINAIDVNNQEAMFNELKSVFPSLNINKLIIMNPSPSNTSGIPFLTGKLNKLNIITEWRSKSVLESYNAMITFTMISKNRFNMKLKSGRVLHFIKAPFLPSAGDFLIYDEQSKTLFSSQLYSSITSEFEIESIMQQHEILLPSSDFVKPVNNVVSKLDVERILTLNGTHIIENKVNELLLETYKHEFYNTDFVVKNMPLINRTYDYINILNQYLLRLSNLFNKEEITDAFNETEIILDPTTIQIKSTELRRRVLYNRFFDIIYEKNGILWLNVLEASVNRIARKYYVQKPDIYKSRAIELQNKVDVLRKDNSILIERTETLYRSLQNTKDQMLKCPLTGLYNKQFFVEYLTMNMEYFAGLFVVEIDNLELLNKQYSYEVGDETIRHLLYQLQNDLPSDVLLFRDDTGILVYFSNYTNEEILTFATKYRNEISKANTFIEPVTVGIGVVFKSDITVEKDETEFILEEVYQRVTYAHQIGAGEIVYQSISPEMSKDGALLLVDDDQYNIGVIRRICDRENIEMYQCFDVYQAMDIVKSKDIDIILSEINLSKLDAFQLKTELNKSLMYNNIPFIIASHNKTKDTIIRANALSVDYILEKPFYPEELLGLLKRILNK